MTVFYLGFAVNADDEISVKVSKSPVCPEDENRKSMQINVGPNTVNFGKITSKQLDTMTRQLAALCSLNVIN